MEKYFKIYILPPTNFFRNIPPKKIKLRYAYELPLKVPDEAELRVRVPGEAEGGHAPAQHRAARKHVGRALAQSH